MQNTLSIITQIVTLLGILFAVYLFFRKPTEKAENKIELIAQGCDLRHKGIDKDIYEIKEAVRLIKENHLYHIEESLKSLSENQAKIFTILDERLKHKK